MNENGHSFFPYSYNSRFTSRFEHARRWRDLCLPFMNTVKTLESDRPYDVQKGLIEVKEFTVLNQLHMNLFN